MSDWIEITGNTDIGELPDHLMTDLGLLRSRFVGATWPANPVPGQPCVRSDRGYRAYTYTNDPLQGESGWVEDALLSATVLALKAELEASRGTAANLGARLSVAMNPDGSLKDPAPVGSWWATEADDVAYASAATFTVEGDKTGVYTAGRALHLVQTASGYGYVVSSTYASGTGLTTVTVRGVVVDSGLFGVEYGQPAVSAPGAIAGKPVPVADVADALKFLCVLADGSGYELAGRIVTDTVAKQLASTTGLLTPANEKAIIADHGGWPGFKNLIINGGMQVAQRAAGSLVSGVGQWGKVDRFRVLASGTVGAGTITQADDSTFNGGKSLHVNGATLSGGGEQIMFYTRIEAKDAVRLRNKTASFRCRIYHDIGSAKDATVSIYKANAEDNFGSCTLIQSSSAQPCASGAYTDVKLEGVSMGDCKYGIMVNVYLPTGSITSKNIFTGEWQLEEGTVCTDFEKRPFQVELALCQRYFQKSYRQGYAPGSADSVTLMRGYLTGWYGDTVANDFIGFNTLFPVTMRAVPTLTLYAPSDGASGYINIGSAKISASVPSSFLSDSGFGYSNYGNIGSQGDQYSGHWTADAEM